VAQELRNKKFKVIPSIKKGSWVVKKAVGQKPAIIGKALTTTYFEAKNEYVSPTQDASRIAPLLRLRFHLTESAFINASGISKLISM